METLKRSSRPLDDDELSARAMIYPRQQVNQICRALERGGVLRRVLGPNGKLVNELVDQGDANPTGGVDITADDGTSRIGQATADAVVTRAPDHSLPAGNSAEQRDAERVMLDLVERQLGVALEPATITVPSGARVEVDGADAGRTVLVECWAHQGPPKSAQRHKVLSDALKLAWIATTIYPRPRLVLCMSDPLAAAPFQPTSKAWAAQALKDLGITVSVVNLPAEVRQRIEAAQKRQYR